MNVRDYGALGNGTHDDTAAIQAAIDAATGSSGPVLFPAGNYIVTRTLTARKASLLGVGPGRGSNTALIWNGASGGGPVVVQNVAAAFWRMAGFSLYGGTANPETWLSIGSADEFLVLEDLQLVGSTGDAIKVRDGYVNCHWRRLRFDGIAGYGINMAIDPTQNLSTFMLEDFTYDNGGRPIGALGLIQFDNSRGNVSNAGTARISDGRIEINSKQGGNSTIVNLKGYGGNGANPDWIGITLQNITYQNVIRESGASLIYQDSKHPSQRYDYQLINVRAEGLAAALGGVWDTTWTESVPPIGRYGVVAKTF
jgi:hypothetical protein